ncbi:acyltransferase [bacterium]|nr:acyltransferase [bacterium]
MSTQIRRVGLLQHACTNDPKQNLEKVCQLVRQAAAQGAQIICTQELFRSLYFCQVQSPEIFDLAETIPGPSTDALQALARELGVVIVGSLFEKRAPGLYHNTAVIIDADGELLGIYRKMHIPDDPLYFEKYYFTPGDTGFKAWQTRFGRIGVLVCWDQWYPEGARLTALDGAEILFYPTAIGWHEHERETFGEAQHDAWETIQRAHAIANGVYVCGINRIGQEGTVTFFGQSYIADPFGRLLYRATHDQEEVIVRDLDLSTIEETRRNWPFLRDRRIDAYGDITKRFRA